MIVTHFWNIIFVGKRTKFRLQSLFERILGILPLKKCKNLIFHTMGRFQKDAQRKITQHAVVTASVALMATLVAIKQFVAINLDLGSCVFDLGS